MVVTAREPAGAPEWALRPSGHRGCWLACVRPGVGVAPRRAPQVLEWWLESPRAPRSGRRAPAGSVRDLERGLSTLGL